MSQTKIPNIETNAPPLLALTGPDYTTDPDGDPDAAGLILGCKGVNSSNVFYSEFPFTTQSFIPGSETVNRPAFADTGFESLGQVWAWKNTSGTGMSWYYPNSTGIETIPNHAHTASAPALLLVGLAIDPNTGPTDYNLFTLFWQGDAKSGSDGTAHELWFMSYQDDGWQSPVQIAGANPVTSPSACLTPSGATLAWTDSYGQIWLTQTQSEDSGDTGTRAGDRIVQVGIQSAGQAPVPVNKLVALIAPPDK
jgi:hypothetical protein